MDIKINTTEKDLEKYLIMWEPSLKHTKMRNANMRAVKIIQQSRIAPNNLDKLSDDNNMVMINP